MKKIYTLIAGFILFGSITSKGQDTLLYESFNFQRFYDTYLIKTSSAPPGLTTDTLWYSFDVDGLADGSGGNREGGWFAVKPFADVDTTNNVAIGANSWFGSPAVASNYLITPNVLLGDHDTLFWKSAPSQTPRYLDGYQVLISTTDNSDLSFSDTLFTAAEMLTKSGTTADSTFSGYTFSPGFVHGLDSTYTEFRNDSARLKGILKPFSVALDAYANQNIFIAIHHNSFDDNLISIDDMMIRGTLNPLAGIKENKSDLNLNVFPNPAEDHAQLNFNLSSETSVTITLNDITGKLIYSENKGLLIRGRHFARINTAALAKGFYTIAVQTKNGSSTAKLIVQ